MEQADGFCKQTFIARRDKSATRAEADRYIVVRYKTSCTQLIPEERLNTGRKRNLKLKRDATCDQIFEQLRWFVTISPGGTINKDPWLKTVRGWEEIKVPAEKKLSCYVLTSSEL